MAINAYTGLMGSGKSYECVSSVIIPAIRDGRRVVTNVDGIDGDAIRAYCSVKFGIGHEKLGDVIHCANDQVGQADFLPFGVDDVDTFCKPGDLICIDEAWRFWGTDCKLLQEHKIFFREHRHYVDPETKVSCDLVLMVQDISDLNRIVKVVVELSFRTSKLKSLGFNKVYRVDMWQGHKQTIKGRVSSTTKKYDAEIFPLYSSYSGGKGKEVVIDGRQNIFRQKKTWFFIVGVLLLGGFSVYSLIDFFNPKNFGGKETTVSSGPKSPAPVVGPQTVRPSAGSGHSRTVAAISADWRVVGTMAVSGEHMVVLVNSSGQTRLEHPSAFSNSGALLTGEVDGKRVTTWSGGSPLTDR